MKKQKWLIGLITTLVIVLGIVTVVSAQEEEEERNGSIRGTVYLDENGNGKCVDEGEPTHPGVPIEFVSDDGKWSTYLQTGDDGTYGLVAAAYGTWKVSARPNANDFVVTSEPTLEAFVGLNNLVVLNVDFCIQATDGETSNTTTSNAILPQAGDGFNSGIYILMAIVGLAFVSAGAYISFLKA